MSVDGPNSIPGVYKPCFVANPVVAVLHRNQDYFAQFLRSGPTQAALWEELRKQLIDPALAKAAIGEDGPEVALAAAEMIEQLSREFPGAVADILKDAWLAAYDNDQPFNLETSGVEHNLIDDFNEMGRVRMTVDFDEQGVDVKITHGTRHADWYAPRPPGRGVQPPPAS